MADVKSFRTAFRGFHRDEVVHYIEYITNKHNAQVEQLNNQLRAAQEELARLKSAPAAAPIPADLQELQARYSALEAGFAEYKALPTYTEADELETYRRAERTERLARERAAQIYTQANAILAEATLKVDDAAIEMADQLEAWTAVANSAKNALQEAAGAMYAIRPED